MSNKVQDQNEELKPTLDDVPDVNEAVEEEDAGFGGDKKKKRRKRKIVLNLKCPLCEGGVKSVTYKDVYQLKKFTSVRGKIISTEKSGVCHKHQNQIKRAIKRARYLALLPYVAEDK
jgi:small subunit ribosomal protein S18